MLSTSAISKMLQQPQSITEADRDKIQELINKYPYFVIGRYLGSVLDHKKNDFSPEQIATERLYINNWLLYKEFVDPTAQIAIPNEVVIEETAVIIESEPELPETTNTAEDTAVYEDTYERTIEVPIDEAGSNKTGNEPLIQPIYTEDYFLHQGVQVSDDIPADVEELGKHKEEEEKKDPKSLMVMMSFSEWLMHYKTQKAKALEEEEDKKALKTMWQKEKLAAALEEENDEIPETVFEIAVNSITKEDDLASESLAEIHYKQGRYDKAIDMYRKLSLRNPQKKVYFARKIEEILKEKQS